MNESEPRSNVHYLGSSENKAWKKFQACIGFNHDLVRNKKEKLIKFKDNALCLVSQISIKEYLETIALEPNNGLLIHEGNSNSLPLQ